MPVSKRPHFIRVRQSECIINDVMRAVIRVHGAVEDPGSDRWHQVSRYRANLYDMVCRQWCEMTGSHPEDFPFSEDYVVHRLYTSYRKTSVEIDNEVTRYLNVPKNIEKENKAKERELRKQSK